MGTLPALSLQCPLCCDEKFSSHISLKYHILSIIQNIICPACDTRLDSLLELAEHIGRECKEPETDNVSVANIKEGITQEIVSSTNTELTGNTAMKIEIVQVKEENSEAIEAAVDINKNMFSVWRKDSKNEKFVEDKKVSQIIEHLNEDGTVDTIKLVEIDKFLKDKPEKQKENIPVTKVKNRKVFNKSATACESKQPIIKIHRSHVDSSKIIVNRKLYTCNICKMMFSSYKSLHLHKVKHNPIKNKDPLNYSSTRLEAFRKFSRQILQDGFVKDVEQTESSSYSTSDDKHRHARRLLYLQLRDRHLKQERTRLKHNVSLQPPAQKMLES